MTREKSSEADGSHDSLRAKVALRLGRVAEFEADAELKSAGLLSVSILVSGILLSTAVLVAGAIRESRRSPADSAPRLRGPAVRD